MSVTRPPEMGSLGRELARVTSRLSTAVLVAASAMALAVVTFGLQPLALEVGARFGYLAGIWLFGIGAVIILVLVTAVVAFLPPLLLRGEDRAAFAAHSWIGAREARRAFGRPSRLVGVFGTPEAAERFLASAPSRAVPGSVRIDAFLLLGRLEEARTEASRLPERTPLEAYRKLEAEALVDEQAGIPLDEGGLRDAISRIAPGIDRTEAAASLAVALARRAVPSGAWRVPLIEVRALIAESDVTLLTRDHGLISFEVLARRVLLPLVLLIVLLGAALSAAPLLVG